MKVVVIHCQMGNVGSVLSMLKKLRVPASLSSDPQEIAQATHLILPGVGAFDHGMAQIQGLGLQEILTRKVIDEGTPVLGICLGMQIMTQGSEEGKLPGLGWIRGHTRRFRFEGGEPPLRVPHVGWNFVEPLRRKPLFPEIADDYRFYFTHSYYVHLDNAAEALAVAKYGIEFTAAFERENIFGVQFHPEKSHRFGLKLFESFVQYHP